MRNTPFGRPSMTNRIRRGLTARLHSSDEIIHVLERVIRSAQAASAESPGSLSATEKSVARFETLKAVSARP